MVYIDTCPYGGGIGGDVCKLFQRSSLVGIGGVQYCCYHPVWIGGEPIESVSYCAFDKYTEIAGKWVWEEDVNV